MRLILMGRSRLLAFGGVGVIAIAAAGCGSSSSSSKTTSSAVAAPAAPTTTAAPAAAPAAAAGTLHLTANANGQIKFDQSTLSAKAGKVTIVMTNPASSGLQHAVGVEGNGVDQGGAIVGPGKTSTVSVTLKKGTYTFYCPFDSHKAQGMKGTLTVS